MKKIVPFNNVLDFNTDVKEITAISLEHEIKKSPDMISGVFYISGEYKITDGQLEKEKFNFELPFDIALSSNYNIETLLVDIDDFRYNIISDKSLKVNIDLYIDGEIIEEPLERNIVTEELPIKDITTLADDILATIKDDNSEEIKNEEKSKIEDISDMIECDEELSVKEDSEEEPKIFDLLEEPNRIDLLKDMLQNTNKEDTMKENININIDNENEQDNKNINNNILTPNEEEQYVTYRVYKVSEGDTLDSILTKYNITKEMLSDYNNIENINPGDKLIIPTNEK